MVSLLQSLEKEGNSRMQSIAGDFFVELLAEFTKAKTENKTESR